MSFCTSCGESLAVNGAFCTKCGAPQVMTTEVPASSWADRKPPPIAAPGVKPVSFIAAIKLGFKNYAVFAGRSSRAQFWYWLLFATLAGLAGEIIFGLISGFVGNEVPSGIYYIAQCLFFFLPGLSITVRRLHDLDKFAAWIFGFWIFSLVWTVVTIAAITALGAGVKDSFTLDQPAGSTGASPPDSSTIILYIFDGVLTLAMLGCSILLLIWWCTPGSPHANRFGPATSRETP